MTNQDKTAYEVEIIFNYGGNEHALGIPAEAAPPICKGSDLRSVIEALTDQLILSMECAGQLPPEYILRNGGAFVDTENGLEHYNSATGKWDKVQR